MCFRQLLILYYFGFHLHGCLVQLKSNCFGSMILIHFLDIFFLSVNWTFSISWNFFMGRIVLSQPAHHRPKQFLLNSNHSPELADWRDIQFPTGYFQEMFTILSKRKEKINNRMKSPLLTGLYFWRAVISDNNVKTKSHMQLQAIFIYAISKCTNKRKISKKKSRISLFIVSAKKSKSNSCANQYYQENK